MARESYAGMNWSLAIDISQKYLQHDPQNVEMAFILGMSLASDKTRYSQALVYLEKAINAPGLAAKDRNLAIGKASEILVAQSKFEEAEEALKNIDDWAVIEGTTADISGDNFQQYVNAINSQVPKVDIKRTVSSASTFDCLVQGQEQSYKQVLKRIDEAMNLLQQLSRSVGHIEPQSLLPLHRDALKHIRQLAEDYPLNPYCVVAKSLEIAFAHRHSELLDESQRVCEIGSRESTFSKYLLTKDSFGGTTDKHIHGFGLSPLAVKAARLDNRINSGTVCDCINLPVNDSAFDCLLSHDFLKHVSDKTAALQHYARVSRYSLYNDITANWVLGLEGIKYCQAKGCHNVVKLLCSREMRNGCLATSLQKKEQLDYLAQTAGLQIVDSCSYLSAETMSHARKVATEDTVSDTEKILCLSAPLKQTVLPLTEELCRLLIIYDALLGPQNDTRVSYLCKSADKIARPLQDETLRCPVCATMVVTKDPSTMTCRHCARTYNVKDEMCFLIPDNLAHVEQNYSPYNIATHDPALYEKARRLHEESLVYILHDHDPISDELDIHKSIGMNGKGYVSILDSEVTGEFNFYRNIFDGWSQRCMKKFKAVVSEIEEKSDRVLMIRNTEDLLTAYKTEKLGLLLACEGAKLLEGRPEALDEWHRLGLRQLQLTWAWPNQVAGSFFNPDSGLSEAGKQVIRKMNELGMIIDLTHASQKTYYETLELSSKPIIFSHGGCREVLNRTHPTFSPYWTYFKDEDLQAMKQNGGLLGIHFFKPYYFRKKGKVNDMTIETLLDHFDYAVDIMGIEHVALGGDYFPAYGEWYYMQAGQNSVPIEYVVEKRDLIHFTAALLNRGYSEEDAKKILGGNFLRVCKEVLG